jgi:hypothetical protein
MGMEWGATLVRSISLDFLGVGPFCREGHPHEVERRRNGKLGVEAMRKRTVIHRVSLT